MMYPVHMYIMCVCSTVCTHDVLCIILNVYNIIIDLVKKGYFILSPTWDRFSDYLPNHPIWHHWYVPPFNGWPPLRSRLANLIVQELNRRNGKPAYRWGHNSDDMDAFGKKELEDALAITIVLNREHPYIATLFVSD